MIIPPPITKLEPLGPILAAGLAEGRAKRPTLIPLSPNGEAGYQIKWPRQTEPSPEAVLLEQWVGEREIGEALDATTDHAWLVVLGHFAQALELVAKLEGVPLAQRQGANGPPQLKLIEFLVGILGGIEYLQELNRGARPIATDPSLAEAWGQQIFGHYSQVSRSLAVADEETLAAVIESLRQVSAPFIQAAVMETIKQNGRLLIDVDLTGRQVSPTSQDYEGADFGWMDDAVHKGYQAALTSLVCERWQRLLLTLQRYPGRTQSAECLQAAVQEVEELLQVRPRRRVELVKARCQDMAAQLAQLEAKLAQGRQQQERLWDRIRQAKAEIKAAQSQVAHLAAEYQAQGRTERPHSQLAKARRQVAAAQKREARAWRDLDTIEGRIARQQPKIDEHQAALLSLEAWWVTLDTDNRANPNPVPMVVRLDAGFSTGPNLTWLIEMGYTVLTKAHHSSTSHSLRQRLPSQPVWTRVGQNAEAVAMGPYEQNACPYPLQAMLLRYHLPDKIGYTTLFYYDQSPSPPLPAWFDAYNGRQTIEAGIKESKGVFTLKRHLVRSPIGMQLQEQFALFGANLVRWAAAWAKTLLAEANQNFITALDQVKTLVRVVSHTRARWVRNACGNTLIFEEHSPFAGTIISLSGRVAVQLPLRLFNFAPP